MKRSAEAEEEEEEIETMQLGSVHDTNIIFLCIPVAKCIYMDMYIYYMDMYIYHIIIWINVYVHVSR